MGYAGGIVFDKISLCHLKVPLKKHISLLFVFLALLTLVFIPSLGTIDTAKFSFFYGFLFVLMIAVAITYNIYGTRGMQRENLHEYELIMLLSPLMTVLLAALFLPSERNWNVFLSAVVASIAFIVSKFKSHHLHLGVTARGTLLAMVLMSFESVLVKELLSLFSPVSLYFIRTAVVALVYLLMFRPKLSDLPVKSILIILGSAACGVLQMVLKFYGFKDLGVIETSMILLLGPVIVYLFSYFYFGERKIVLREVISTAVIVSCILYATFLK
jgi:drug/metabolite transporter (DMT)-like permease